MKLPAAATPTAALPAAPRRPALPPAAAADAGGAAEHGVFLSRETLEEKFGSGEGARDPLLQCMVFNPASAEPAAEGEPAPGPIAYELSVKVYSTLYQDLALRWALRCAAPCAVGCSSAALRCRRGTPSLWAAPSGRSAGCGLLWGRTIHACMHGSGCAW